MSAIAPLNPGVNSQIDEPTPRRGRHPGGQTMQATQAEALLGHADELRALAWCLVRSDGADDLVQDAWVAALTSASRPHSPRAWLRQVLRNEFRLRVRSERRRLARERVVLVEALEASLDDVAMRDELAHAITQALERLEEPYRRVVRARFFLGRTPAEIASDTGTPPATVRWQIHEGLRRIRIVLDDRYGERQRWCGGAVAIAAAPAARKINPAMGVEKMFGKLTVVQWVLGGSVGAGAIAMAIGAGPSRAAAIDGAARDEASAAEHVRVIQPATIDGITAAPPLGTAHEPADEPTPADPDEPTCDGTCEGPVRQVISDPAPLEALLAECEHLLPQDTARGRFEIEVGVRGGPEGVGNTITSVEITRGRKLPCIDPDADFDEPDGPDVRQFPVVAECIQRSLTPGFVEAIDDGQEFRMVAVLGDATLTEQRANAAVWSLPEPSDAVRRLEPDQAISALALPAHDDLAAGKVSIVECGGYDCSYCNRARTTLDELRTVYGDRLSIYFLQMPLDMHAGAPLTARAAVAAAAQGRFWAMHEALFDRPEIRSEAGLVELARELGLDARRFARDLAAPATAQAVADQREVCTHAGAQGTPAFFIDGDLVTGNQDIAAFREIIDESLAR